MAQILSRSTCVVWVSLLKKRPGFPNPSPHCGCEILGCYSIVQFWGSPFFSLLSTYVFRSFYWYSFFSWVWDDLLVVISLHISNLYYSSHRSLIERVFSVELRQSSPSSWHSWHSPKKAGTFVCSPRAMAWVGNNLIGLLLKRQN